MPNYAYIALIPLLPLAGFVLLGMFGRKYFRSSEYRQTVSDESK